MKKVEVSTLYRRAEEIGWHPRAVHFPEEDGGGNTWVETLWSFLDENGRAVEHTEIDADTDFYSMEALLLAHENVINRLWHECH